MEKIKPDQKELFEKVDPSKRAFLKKLAMTSAFAVPVIQSFSMDGLKAKSAHAAFGTRPPPASPL